MKPATLGRITAENLCGLSKANQEEIYPFGVQNDLGQVCVPGPKLPRENDGPSPHRSNWNHSPIYLYQSTSNLAVPSNGVSVPQSSSFHSLHSTSIQYSRASSINDLSFEADQLERSIRQNDSTFVKRMLEIHHGKFNVNLHGSLLDKSSCDTHSQCISQEVEILLRKSQTLIDRLGRQESLSTDQEVPAIFTNALHFAIEHEALDVIRMLLKYGVEPNEGGTGAVGHDAGQRGSFYSLVSSSGASEDGLSVLPEKTRKASLQLLTPRYAKLLTNDSMESGHSSASPKPTLCLHSDLPQEKRTVRYDHEGRAVSYSDEYTREYLYTLPALFLATVYRNSEAVYLLAKYGANTNIQDCNGCTPLHLSVCQDKISWPCVCTLLESGARIGIANQQGFTPQDLCPDLRKLQESIVEDIFSDFFVSTSGGAAGAFGAAGMGSGSGHVPNAENNVPDGVGNAPANSSAPKHTAGLFRRLHSEVRNNLKSSKKFHLKDLYQEEASFISLEQPCSLSHHGSVRSRRSTRSNYDDRVDPNDKDGNSHRQTILQRLGSRRSREKNRVKHNSCYTSHQAGMEKPELLEAERKLIILTKMAVNPECTEFILRGLHLHTAEIIELSDQATSAIHRAVARLLNQLLETAVTTYAGEEVCESHENRCRLAAVLCMLLYVVLGLMQGGQALQYTALTTLNKIIDTCIIRQIGHQRVTLDPMTARHNSFSLRCGQMAMHLSANSCAHSSSASSSSPWGRSPKASVARKDSVGVHALGKRWAGMWRQSSCDKSPDEPPSEPVRVLPLRQDSVLGILSKINPGLILNILHNAITLHKRVVGTKQQCTPSNRWRHCSYHCLQILSARVLLYISQSPEVQAQLVNEVHLKILTSALDATHDPQLLCFILQLVATLALNPNYHPVLNEADIGDTLTQLILPSDEWYYTNHSTKYARYVKHHAARILVYLGMHHRLGNRVSLFDLFGDHGNEKLSTDELPPTTPATNSPEDLYIMQTSISPRLIRAHVGHHQQVSAASVEGAILEILSVMELKVQDTSESLNSRIVSADDAHSTSPCPDQDTGQMRKDAEAEDHQYELNSLFQMGLPLLIHPVVLLRLLMHRLTASLAILKKVRSGHLPTSRTNLSDFRTRANSSDGPDCRDSLSKRRKVNLTVDCSNLLSMSGGSPLPPSPPATTRPRMPRRSSVKIVRPEAHVVIRESGSGGALGSLASTVFSERHTHSASVEFSSFNNIRTSPSRQDMSDSGNSSKGNTPVTSPSFFSKRNFRFSSLVKKRSKSHANISTKASNNLSDFSPPQHHLPASACEADIMAFQRELQNLPQFDSYQPLTSLPIEVPPRTAVDHTRFGRPRSRSVPKVILESSFLLAPPPPLLWGLHRGTIAGGGSGTAVGSGNLTATGLQRPLSDGHTPPSQRSTPSVSPVPLHGTIEITAIQSAVLKLVEEWAKVFTDELGKTTLVRRELCDFVSKVSTMGEFYKEWSQKLRTSVNIFDLHDNEEDENDNSVVIDEEYCKLQRLVVSGELPCSKDEAAALAGIQLRIEESWPSTKRSQQQLKEDIVAGSSESGHKLRPIAEDVKETNLALEYGGLLVSGSDGNRSNYSETDTDSCQSTATITVQHSITNKISNSATKLQRRTGLLRQCMPIENRNRPVLSPIRLEDCMPPAYLSTKNIAKQVKEHKRKLFHTSVYDSEVQLKKLYIQTCKRLPAYGCRIYQVKELLRGKTKKKATRLLGIGYEKIILLDYKTRLLAKSQPTAGLRQWRMGGGRSHDRLILEFRGTKWSFVTMTPMMLKNISIILWEIMQSMGGMFLEETVIQNREAWNQDIEKTTLAMRPVLELDTLYTEELEGLQKILHFPEEVAIRVTDVEYELFCSVPPVAYIRQVTLDLSNSAASTGSSTVHALVKRFIEVSSWVTHIIISQPTHEDRKAVLSCILRIALCCWNIGNFNAATEILAGLKSEKLRPFWLSLSDKEPVTILDGLSDALLTPDPSAEYREALNRALDIPECKVVPFFGSFLRELKAVLTGTPSLIVLAPNGADKLEFISDYNGDDHFMTRIGVGGLINVEKLRKAQVVLDKISQFHEHACRRSQLMSERNRTEPKSPCLEAAPCSEDSDPEYEIDLEEYQPIQPLENDHGVRFVPVRGPAAKVPHPPLTLDVHFLQCLHHGFTVIHWECDGSRIAMVYLKLECNNATLSWCKPTWSALRGSGAPDYALNANVEEHVSPGYLLKYASTSMDSAISNLEEGFLELSIVKEVTIGRPEIDLNIISRRMGFEDMMQRQNCISLIYGTNLSDNRIVDFVAPTGIISVLYRGLRSVILGLRRQRQLSDRRIHWLKEQYLQLYHEEGLCVGPTPAEAIKVFGGRKWTLGSLGSMTSVSEIPNSSFKRAASFGVAAGKFRKKKSQTALQVIKDTSPKIPAGHSLSDSTADRKVCSPGKLRKTTPPRPQSEPDDLASRASPTLLHDTFDRSGISPGHIKPGSISGREKFIRKSSGNSIGAETQTSTSAPSITHSSQLDFLEFVELFHSFSIRARKDLKDLFEQIASTKRSISETSLNDGDRPKSELACVEYKHHGIITRNSPVNYMYKQQRKKICDAIAAASIVTNCAGVETSKSQSITMEDFRNFLITHQGEHHSDEEIINLILRHEPDTALREQNCLSFEGFAQYLMDKDNYTFVCEKTKPVEEDMDHPLSHYYVATSHNTYLTGHQLKGESSVELYSQVLLTGCRCVELDCWDGDDGIPLIYHGHTLTTKIPFKNVVNAINKSAFVTSAYPVILSIENHCSVLQQAKMAQLFINIFGERLVTKFMFESDFSDDPQLPSPNQLKYKILIKNKKLHAELTPALALKHKGKTSSTRTNSIVSNTSMGSLNDNEDDEYDDDEDDDDMLDDKDITITRQSLSDSPPMTLNGQDLDEKLSTGNMSKSTSLGLRTESLSSQDGSLKEKLVSPPAKGHVYMEWPTEEDPPTAKTKKQSSQIAQELSDIVIYCQAIKFRGLSPGSPTSSLKIRKNPVKRTMLPAATVAAVPATPPLEIKAEVILQHQTMRRQPSAASCYQVSSLNENTAKKLSRKHPQGLITHTENHIMRTYPAGMRIDSSNFNPVIFWAFGFQMVALNYQTEDAALHINTAMFEQNGRCGYVLKPRVMWDRTHMMYQRFNPWDKEFDGLHSVNLTLTVISGQYVCQHNHTVSPSVEVEIIGIPIDCAKQKTKLVQRNALNPIWNDTFHFRVMFEELAFLRFTVIDMATNHITAQRVIPLKCLRPGYRHVRLRNLQNQSLHLSTLFINSRLEEEVVEVVHQNGDVHDPGKKIKCKTKDVVEPCKVEGKEVSLVSGCPLKRRMFFLMVHGVVPDEPYTILKITQDSTTQEVIQQALSKGNKIIDRPEDYVIIEEVHKGWEKKDLEKSTVQRILGPDERPLEAQAKWKGEGKFILKKTGDDPSSRAWISTILSSATKERKRHGSEIGDDLNDWEEEETFLVCVHNVSPEIPYAILKAPISSTSHNIIAQALLKARRMEDPTKFVLVEVLEFGQLADNPSGSIKRRTRTESRTLDDDESVYHAQAAWKTMGKFLLKEKDEVPCDKKPIVKKTHSTLGKLGKIKISSCPKPKEKMLVREIFDDFSPKCKSYNLMSEQQMHSLHPEVRSGSFEDISAIPRLVHSEEEAQSEDDNRDLKSAIAKLKKVSLMKLKAWS